MLQFKQTPPSPSKIYVFLVEKNLVSSPRPLTYFLFASSPKLFSHIISSLELRCPYKKSCASSTNVSWSRSGKEVRTCVRIRTSYGSRLAFGKVLTLSTGNYLDKVREKENRSGKGAAIWIRTKKKKRSGVKYNNIYVRERCKKKKEENLREIFKNEDRDFLHPGTRSPRTPPPFVSNFARKKINPHFFFWKLNL